MRTSGPASASMHTVPAGVTPQAEQPSCKRTTETGPDLARYPKAERVRHVFGIIWALSHAARSVLRMPLRREALLVCAQNQLRRPHYDIQARESRSGLRFPLVRASAARAPFAEASFDLAVWEYGAAVTYSTKPSTDCGRLCQGTS
jgi:hypothetical protein